MANEVAASLDIAPSAQEEAAFPSAGAEFSNTPIQVSDQAAHCLSQLHLNCDVSKLVFDNAMPLEPSPRPLVVPVSVGTDIARLAFGKGKKGVGRSAGNGTTQESRDTIGSTVDDYFLQVQRKAKEWRQALDGLVGYVAKRPDQANLTRAYRTVDMPAANKLWDLYKQDDPEVKAGALKGLEAAFRAPSADSGTLSLIMTRVLESPRGCADLVNLGLEHPNPAVQRAAARTTKQLEQRGNSEFSDLWNKTARSLSETNALWEKYAKEKSAESLEELIKLLMSRETDPKIQSFILKLVAESVEGNYPLLEAALKHTSAKLRRSAAEIVQDLVEKKVPGFEVLWNTKVHWKLRESLQAERKARNKAANKQRKSNDHEVDDDSSPESNDI